MQSRTSKMGAYLGSRLSSSIVIVLRWLGGMLTRPAAGHSAVLIWS